MSPVLAAACTTSALVAITHLGPFVLGDRSWVAELRATTGH